MQQHPIQRQQQKHILKKNCSPGALSSYRDLRKKQMQEKGRENDFENTSNIHAENESQPSLINANEVGFLSDHQPICDEDIEVEAQTNRNPDEGLIDGDPKNKKHRGPTKLAKVHARTLEERPKKYVVPVEGKDWALVTVNEQWKSWKSRCKSLYYYAYDTNDERWNKRPKTIPEHPFRELLSYWDSEPIKEESDKNRSNRQMANDIHTMGPTSYAMLREKLKQEDPNKEEPSKAKVYIHSRKRKPGKSYKTSFGKMKQNIEQMEAIESQEHEGSNYKDPYGEVMKKPEHSGRVRLFGKGVTMTDLKKGGKNSSYIFPQKFLQSMQSQVVGQLLDANPQLKQLLEVNPEVKIVLPDMTKTGSNGRSPASESNGHSSIGAHSDNRLVHVELNDGMEEGNHIQPTV